MLSYIGQKYGEEFDFTESYAGQAGANYTMILVKSRQYGERQAFVRMAERDGKWYYEDNYLAYLLKDEIEQIESSLACQCFGECKIDYKIPGFVFPFYFKGNMTAKEFLTNSHSMTRFNIYPKKSELHQEDWEEKANNFRKMNAEKGYKIRGTLFLERDKLIFSMDENGNFRYRRWLSL